MSTPGRLITLTLTLVFTALATSPARAACAWVLWVEESWLVAYKRDERPTRWTLVEAHQSQADCERAQTTKIKILSKKEDKVHQNIISRTVPGGYEQTNITLNVRVICVPDSIDPRRGTT